MTNCVKAFFANGGARCWVHNIAESLPDESESNALLNQMLGLNRPPDEIFGLEALLRQHEVSIVALPELDAEWVEQVPRDALPAKRPRAFLVDCDPEPAVSALQRPPRALYSRRFFADDQVLWAQRYLIERLQREPWRWFAVLGTPPSLLAHQAVAWRQRLVEKLADVDGAALYWPWVRTQATREEPARLESPVGHVCGVIAHRDLGRGPHVAPANESLRGVTGVAQPVEDDANAVAYEGGVNVLRSFAGRGVQVWGARTLQWQRDARNEPLSYITGRRSLSAIAKTAEQIGQNVAFEPNSVMLRLQISQSIMGYLLDVFDSGALMGASPEEAFFVRCDSANNPVHAVERGELLCEVGVALAVPAEFIWFRLGRKQGLTQLLEVA